MYIYIEEEDYRRILCVESVHSVCVCVCDGPMVGGVATWLKYYDEGNNWTFHVIHCSDLSLSLSHFIN
jgi:hypothetical protein